MKIAHKRTLAGFLLAIPVLTVWAAIDSAAKRSSALGVSIPSTVLVIPDGTIGAADRQTVTGMYGGLAAGADVTAPEFVSAAIAANGDDLTITPNEAVTQGAGYADTDWTLTCSGGAATLTYASGDGTTAHVYTISRTIEGGPDAETCTLDFDGSANSLEDAAGNDLAALVDEPVTNGSTADTTAPTVTSARISAAAMTVYFSEEPFQGAGYNNADWTVTCSGGAVTPTLLAIGSISILFELSREVEPDETCTLAHDGSANSVEDAAGNDLAAFSGQAIAISSEAGCVAVLSSALTPAMVPAINAAVCAGT